MLIDRYQKPIFNAAIRITGDYSDAQDVAQNVFIKAYQNLKAYNPEYKFFSWIYKMTVNESINLLRQQNRLAEPFQVSGECPPTPETEYHSNQADRKIDEALMEINLDQRIVIVLRYFLNLSHRDMSQMLEVPEKTIKSRLYTARENLRCALSKRGLEQI